jgi:hypothetical protein
MGTTPKYGVSSVQKEPHFQGSSMKIYENDGFIGRKRVFEHHWNLSELLVIGGMF